MINPIALSTRVTSVVGIFNSARPNNQYTGPVLGYIGSLFVGSIFGVYKATIIVYKDIRERIEYYYELN